MGVDRTAFRPARTQALGVAALGLGGGGASLAFGPPEPMHQLALALPLVALLGLPHGAADYWVAKQTLAPRLGRRWRALFLLGYAGLAAAVILAWTLAPAAILAGFLGVSALHFGWTDVPARSRTDVLVWLGLLARGLLPLAAVSFVHPEDVARWFAWLIPQPDGPIKGQTLQAALAACFAPSWGVLALLVARDCVSASERSRRRASETLMETIAITATALPPALLGFALYFCLWHAPRHTIEVVGEAERIGVRRPLRELARHTFAPWLATLALGAAAVAWLGSAAPALGKVLFVGLAALTLPHLVLSLIGVSARQRETVGEIGRRRPSPIRHRAAAFRGA